jgi:hypothetical protein
MAAGLVSNMAWTAVLLAIWNLLFITTQLTMGVFFAPLAVHHDCISCKPP